MINTYKDFILLKENWENDLKRNVISLVSDIITPDEIEDYFLDFKDTGFRVSIELRIGYGEGHHYRDVRRKIDVSDHTCYANYEISIHKEIREGNNIKNVQKTLEYYISLSKSFVVACERLSSLHSETQIIDNTCVFNTGSITFDAKLKLDRKIPRSYVEVDGALPKYKAKTTYERILNAISTNKIFTIDGGDEGKKIRFSSNYQPRSGTTVDTILDAILGRFNNFNLRKLSPNRYEITILEK